jgi:hypothetical protein
MGDTVPTDRPRTGRCLLTGTLVASVLLLASGSHAQTCDVPSQYPTITSALAQPACVTIVVAAGTFAETLRCERDVTIQGGGSGAATISGAVRVSPSAAAVHLSGLTIDASTCAPEAIVIDPGGQLTTDEVVTTSGSTGGACVIFADGFESGNTAAWSEAAP